MCEAVRCVCVWTCVSVQWAFTALPKLPTMLSCSTNIKEPNNTRCFYGSLCDPLFYYSFLFRLCPIYEAFLCGCVTWFEANETDRERERERERLVPAGFHVLLCAHISQPCFTVVGSWLIVGPLSSFRHAWPTLISLVYCKPPLITLNTIKANILITACLIISSHRENERFQPHLCNRSYAAQK